ncbi:alpha/beta hydrolase [Deinococcus sp. KSM4-11]|uniref:alpha/beta fold hydrolase n=1 Tax=Deinococcus sp. KSM4-11 TaxID=2568654 RepID=UPI0010A2E751|nr:alpha/beta hydrolase [Deinococcus sp. KSM4-11]THF85595.1 alpha/beta hydrolase [Deinococcus sp. KSM4-11]
MNGSRVSNFSSADGTTIAYECHGTGPALIRVDGALQRGAGTAASAEYAALLGSSFTVVSYDRRGRGASTETPASTVEREVEDLEALVEQVGGQAFVWGHSSGAALAMHTAVRLGGKIRKLVMYEPPYNDDPAARQSWRTYRAQLDLALRSGHAGDAVKLFMRKVGMPDDQLTHLSQSPGWAHLEAVGATLGYDAAVMGEDAAVPQALAARVHCPTLILTGGDSAPFFAESARNLAKTIPRGECRTLTGQAHNVSATVLAPVLTAFFLGDEPSSRVG